MSVARVVRQAAKAVLLAVIGALVGFVASLLRRRPPTSYQRSLQQPVAQDSEQGG